MICVCHCCTVSVVSPDCVMSVCGAVQGGPAGATVGQGGVHAAGGPGSNSDKAMHVRKSLCVMLCCLLSCCDMFIIRHHMRALYY